MDYEDVRTFYLSRGFGGRVGFGRKAAVVVIDMAQSWLDESSALGSANVTDVIRNILPILAAARTNAVSVFFTTMAFDPSGSEADGPVGRKLLHTSKQHALDRGSPLVALDPRLERRADEILIEKQRASAFWGTPFQAYLTARRVDTLIITGCSTSGCVRSTAESAHNIGLHAIVAREAVGDRSALAHQCNLIDIDMRFADVVPSREVLAYLQQREPARPEQSF